MYIIIKFYIVDQEVDWSILVDLGSWKYGYSVYHKHGSITEVYPCVIGLGIIRLNIVVEVVEVDKILQENIEQKIKEAFL